MPLRLPPVASLIIVTSDLAIFKRPDFGDPNGPLLLWGEHEVIPDGTALDGGVTYSRQKLTTKYQALFDVFGPPTVAPSRSYTFTIPSARHIQIQADVTSFIPAFFFPRYYPQGMGIVLFDSGMSEVNAAFGFQSAVLDITNLPPDSYTVRIWGITFEGVGGTGVFSILGSDLGPGFDP